MFLNVILGLLVLVLAYLAWRLSTEATRLRTQYAPIIQIDTAVSAAKEELDRTRAAQQEERATAERDRAQFLREDQERRAKLSGEYTQALATYEGLKRELALVEVGLDDVSFGLYKPHFSFQTPEEYKTALTALRERERSLIHDGRAAVCPINWTVGNSAHEGARMVKQNIKLVLRAFNGECEAARADVSWNNITKMEERIRKSCEAINKLSGVLQVTITSEYLNLKLNELRLTHEYEERKYQDREEQRRIREQIREEERAQREFDKAREEAETEEARYQKALAKAREEAAAATGAALEKLTAQVSAFEAKLDEARKKKERAIARAQLTKSGFVYVISNIGSFGEKVYKIGMTRRLEPMERIVELGGASVPFPFDLHAMLYSDNAPELETGLHHLFADRRVNLVNARREFYRDIELDEIETYVKTKGLSAQFIKDVEAREYRETIAKRSEQQPVAQPATATFPGALFETAGA
jgi:multidrug efflux pump subunit AcrA (membrane-fusion protein)